MKIGLFFGSFNPFHVGHKIIASHMAWFTNLDKIIFIVSPQNPLKQKKSLLDQYHRLQIIRADVQDNDKLDVSDIEFNMTQPSYTIDTLVRIQEKNPKNEYALIMGADNIQTFHKWKNYKTILENYSIYVYPRSGFEMNKKHKNIHLVDGVPKMEISASFIREAIKNGKDVSYMMPKNAWQYMDEMNFYRS